MPAPQDDTPEPTVTFVIDESSANQRLDAFLAQQIPTISRSLIRKAIDAGSATVDDRQVKPSFKLKLDHRVTFSKPPVPDDQTLPENIPLEILFEDDALVAVNKPPRMVVHPAKGHWSGTLTSALAFHFQSLSSVGGATRPGIVHRLDRDTSGVILIAKTDQAHLKLAAQFEARTVQKHYVAYSRGSLDRDQEIVDQPIGPHPYQRDKMAIRAGHKSSREARTLFAVEQRYRGFIRFLARPKTGRTHQIRVHLAHLGCPVVCDRLYAGHSRLTRAEILGQPADDDVVLDRQALHARRIEFAHPLSGESIAIDAPLPEDLARLDGLLSEHRA